MSSSWDMVHSHNLYFAAKGSKILLGLVITFGLLAIVYWMLRSIGIDRNTPPSMVWRKLLSVLRSYFRPLFLRGYWKKAARMEENKKYDVAVDLYLKLFDFDALINARPSIAILNDQVLEHLEGICVQVGYPFPTKRINRLREDIYDYFLVKQKYMSPTDYDGSDLIRAENEERFCDKLNLTQERALVEGFQNFLESMARKLKKHILSGAPPIVTPEQQESAQQSLEIALSVPSNGALPASSAEFAAELEPPADPFGRARMDSGAEVAAPADLFGPGPGEAPAPPALTPPPGIFGAPPSQDAPLPPPPDLLAGNAAGRAAMASEVNPFSLDDPRVPHRDATGRIHKLPGAEDDRRPQSAPPAQDSTQIGPAPAAPAGPGFPQPTGGFPGFGQAAKPAGFPGAPSPSQAPGAPAFPQPTGGFPGFGSQPPGPAAAAPSMGPQPTGGFPGFASQPPGPATPPPGTSFPQPTGGFPGFASQPPGPPATPAFPQPTGGFPGFSSQPPGLAQPPSAPGFPQPTGGFPGFGSQPPGPSQPPAFPQPTGGFPGFASNPPDKEKK